jgi:hypothetical protein
LGDEGTTLFDWALDWLILCVVLWTPAWIWRLRRLARLGPGTPSTRAVTALYLVTLNHLLLVFAAWWVGRLLASFLFPAGPMHWVAAGVFCVIGLALQNRFALLVGRTYALHERDIIRASDEAPVRLVRRELLALAVGGAILVGVAEGLTFAPAVESVESWNSWTWCGRWLLFTSVFIALAYLSSGNWRLAWRTLGRRPQFVLYGLLLAFVLLLQLGNFFKVFVLWWFLRVFVGLWVPEGFAHWAGVGMLFAAFAVLSYRLFSGERREGVSEVAATAESLLRDGGDFVANDLADLLLHVALLVLIEAGIANYPGWTTAIILLMAVEHWYRWRRLKRARQPAPLAG